MEITEHRLSFLQAASEVEALNKLSGYMRMSNSTSNVVYELGGRALCPHYFALALRISNGKLYKAREVPYPLFCSLSVCLPLVACH